MFIISEISPQFHGQVEIAEQMILQSKMAGANAIKVQLYTETQFGAERAYLSMPFEQLKRLKNINQMFDIFKKCITNQVKKLSKRTLKCVLGGFFYRFFLWVLFFVFLLL